MILKVLQKTMKKRDGIQFSLVSKDMPLFIHADELFLRIKLANARKNFSYLQSGNLFRFLFSNDAI